MHTRKIFAFFVCLFLLTTIFCACGNEKEKNASIDTVIVYITKSGSKYHKHGCTYLSRSEIAIRLSDAKEEGYTPCSKCNPPE